MTIRLKDFKALDTNHLYCNAFNYIDYNGFRNALLLELRRLNEEIKQLDEREYCGSPFAMLEDETDANKIKGKIALLTDLIQPTSKELEGKK